MRKVFKSRDTVAVNEEVLVVRKFLQAVAHGHEGGFSDAKPVNDADGDDGDG